MGDLDYIILTAQTPEVLQDKVNLKIPQYLPIGGLSVTYHYNEPFMQAMLLNKKYTIQK